MTSGKGVIFIPKIKEGDHMALINCPECNRQISSAALCCPGCGYPINQPVLPKKKKSVRSTRRANGHGTVYRLSGNRRNPWVASVTTGWELNEKTGRVRQIQKSIGYFPTESKANIALDQYNENPYELTSKIIAVSDLYEHWTDEYFEEIDASAIRTVQAAWQYVHSEFKTQNACTLSPQQIKNLINSSYKIDDKGKKVSPSDNTKSRMKSIFNLMYDYACLQISYNTIRQSNSHSKEYRVD